MEEELEEALQRTSYDFVLLVNPNSPTGTWSALQSSIEQYSTTNFWIDETYIDVSGKPSLEQLSLPNLYICKSMSKSYALSGMRVAYLCGPRSIYMDQVKLRTPPWVVSYPGQLAGILALQEEPYYKALWDQTNTMKQEIVKTLSPYCTVVAGHGNFYLFHTNKQEELYAYMKENGILVRRVELGIRIAVRSPKENETIVSTLLSFFAEKQDSLNIEIK